MKNLKESGFTLIELLAVTVMVGVLSAIAAPSWLAFTNNQRLSAGQSTVFNAIKSAQSEAKKLSRPVTVAITSSKIGQNDLKDVTITSSVGSNISLVFDAKGQPKKVNGADFVPLQLQINASGTSAKRCISIATLLGGIQTKSDPCGF